MHGQVSLGFVARQSKGQVSMELLIGLLAWIVFIAILTSALFAAGKNAASAKDVAEMNAAVQAIVNQAEQVQSTGYTTYVAIESHRTRNGTISVEYKRKEITGKTIVGVDEIVQGQPV